MNNNNLIEEKMNKIKIKNNLETLEEFINNDYKELILDIDEFVTSKSSSIVSCILKNKYISYKHESSHRNSILNLEYYKKKNILEITLYWKTGLELEEAKNKLKNLGIKYNDKEKGIGALRLRPFISTGEEFEIIKPFIIQSIEYFYKEKKLSL